VLALIRDFLSALARLASGPRRNGRAAQKPHHLSFWEWCQVVIEVWRALYRNRLFLVAAGVAFFILLALFPALSALVAVWSLFADPRAVTQAIGDLAFVLPPGAAEILKSQTELVAAGAQHDLTFYIAFSILVSVWSANAGMKALIEALNHIYGVEETRNFVVYNLLSLLFTFGAFAVFIATMLFLVAVPIALAWANFRGGVVDLLAVIRWPTLFAVTVVFLTLLNRFGPCHARQKARWSLWGSTLGAFMWLAVSAAFSWYVGHVGNLAATYGSLAAIAGLMTWLWLSALVVLLGVELNAELELRTRQEVDADERFK
jgi:membrane protein